VTGGAGFIGSHLVDALLSRGARVRVIDDLSTGRREHVPPGAEFRHASILDEQALGASTEDVQIIFHLAAMVSVPQSVAEPVRCAEVNVSGTERVLEAAVAAGVPRLVFASSCAVYGGQPSLPSRECDPIDCLSPYAASKAAAEGLVAAFGRCYAVATTSLRFFNVFGSRQDASSPYSGVVARFVEAMSEGRAPIIYGDGLQTRDFIPVRRVVEALLASAERTKAGAGDTLNVGLGHSITLLDLYQFIHESFPGSPIPRYEPARAGDVRESQADITRTIEALRIAPLSRSEARRVLRAALHELARATRPQSPGR